jgi:hypothetical protein
VALQFLDPREVALRPPISPISPACPAASSMYAA